MQTRFLQARRALRNAVDEGRSIDSLLRRNRVMLEDAGVRTHRPAMLRDWFTDDERAEIAAALATPSGARWRAMPELDRYVLCTPRAGAVEARTMLLALGLPHLAIAIEPDEHWAGPAPR